MSEKKLRLMKLVEHWMEHNEDHVKRFREAAHEAKELGLNQVELQLYNAAENGDKVSKSLLKALEAFEQ
jgi:hypothetical protein